jgi:ABC-type bacteriocin/lantibiotic exporter with double-glycine peptidase domain
MKKFRGWKWLGIMAIMAIIAYQLKKASDRNYPNSYEIKDFGLFEQPDNISCGPSSVKMVLKHYGYVHSLDEVRKIARTDWYVKDDLEIGGTTPEFIERAMEYFGIKAILTTGNLEDIKWYVSQNRPPIALVRSGRFNYYC